MDSSSYSDWSDCCTAQLCLLLKHVVCLLEIRLRKLVDEREKMIEQVGQ